VTSLETTLSLTTSGKDTTICNNFVKLKRIVVIFVKHHQRSKEKLAVERKSTSTINVATLPCKIKRSPSRYTATPKGTKFHTEKQKSVNAYC